MFSAHKFSYYIVSLGCSKNQTESEKLNSILINAGMLSVESAEKADIVFINTCGFIESAKQESIDVIFEALDLKKSSDKQKKIIAVGCLTQRYLENIKDEIPEIDFVYGAIDDNFIKELARFLNIKIIRQKSDNLRLPLTFNTFYEYIKISDGCSNNCSYCAIPLIRGVHKSYSRDMILADARQAARRGVKELIVIAQDIAVYNDNGYQLPDLLKDLEKIEGPEWIRLLYCHPDHVTDQIIEEIKRNQKIVGYLDLPFQHVNSEILKSMNRTGDYRKYLNLVKKLRKELPGIVIRSTFMVGYPGETEDQFNELLKFLKEACLDKVGCFTYSREEDTKAATLPDMPFEIKQKRYDRLMQLQKEISLEKMNSYVGKNVRVLIEEQIDESNWIGRSEYDAPEVDGIFYLTAKGVKINNIVSAKVIDALEYDLVGTL